MRPFNNNEREFKKQGYVVITPTLFQGDTLVWNTEDDKGETIPIVFDKLKEAQVEMLDDLGLEIEQFKDGERDFEDIDFDMGGQYIANIDWTTLDEIYVFDMEGEEILSTTLEEWRKSL